MGGDLVTKWAPSYCDLCSQPAPRVFFKVRTIRLVDGRRACIFCTRKPGVGWLIRRAYWPWLSGEVML